MILYAVTFQLCKRPELPSFWNGKLKGQQVISRQVGRNANRRKVEQHFEIVLTDDRIRWQRRAESIVVEAQFDGIDVIRTSLDASSNGAEQAVVA
ncbi:MAG: hypothetical protein OXF60_09295 [Gammaproteobacteria bacterium]|nr:hypothetical protein [Gammaproteobacteria bacterium]MCY4218680.1 hypothetical protein [Gammaproteobacteria bacterium]